MYSHAYSFFLNKYLTARFPKLLIVSALGCLFGTAAAVSSVDLSIPLMRSAVSGTVSIVCVLPTVLQPFLLLLIAATAGLPWLIYLVCGSCSFTYSFCVYMLNAIYGTSGWLVSLCVLFSGSFLLLLIYLSAVRFCGREQAYPVSELIYCAGIAALACLFDCCVVCPFWSSVINC